MRPFDVPTRDEVTEQNQKIFDDLKSKVGFVPNIYATYAYSEHARHVILLLPMAKHPSTIKRKRL